MKHISKAVTFIALCLVWTMAFSAPQQTGVVLLHGKQGTGDEMMSALGGALREAGYLVAAPTTAWSRARIYDASVDDALHEIDREVSDLRAKGAKRIVIAGQSLGANVAIRYAATRSDISGIIALAPAHNPDSATARKLFSEDLERARRLIADGKADERSQFSDANADTSGRIVTFAVTVTPRVYVSWWGEEDGALLMPRNAAAIKSPIPFLYVVGRKDPLTRPQQDIFDKAPAHPLSKYVVVDAGHFQVPYAARSEVLSWLAALSS